MKLSGRGQPWVRQVQAELRAWQELILGIQKIRCEAQSLLFVCRGRKDSVNPAKDHKCKTYWAPGKPRCLRKRPPQIYKFFKKWLGLSLSGRVLACHVQSPRFNPHNLLCTGPHFPFSKHLCDLPLTCLSHSILSADNYPHHSSIPENKYPNPSRQTDALLFSTVCYVADIMSSSP